MGMIIELNHPGSSSSIRGSKGSNRGSRGRGSTIMRGRGSTIVKTCTVGKREVTKHDSIVCVERRKTVKRSCGSADLYSLT